MASDENAARQCLVGKAEQPDCPTGPRRRCSGVAMLSMQTPARSLRFVWRLMTKPVARHRILAMRAVFRTYAEHIGGITLVGTKRVAA